ncbi:MAG: hypothetical protein C5B48_05495 [Candidatus Rokuibacteriota bacterium]|nr:MAG: hypothetical protein C5B48_05495 [Candidatus Rokubacteria bacterium]
MTRDWVAAAEGPLEPISYHALADRPGFKLALTIKNGRHILYISHLWHSGWSILDVTDPASAEHIGYIPGPPDTWTLQVTLKGDLMATSLEPVPPDWGGNPRAAFSEGVLLWDISDPAEPRQLSHFRTGHRGTHRNGFDDRGILHLSARVKGQEGLILMLVDVSDPTAPREIGRFSMPEQVPGRRPPGDLPFGVHGPSLRVGDLAYLPYGDLGLVIVDVARPERPALVGQLSVHPPLGTRIAAHSAVPLPSRNLLVLNSEALEEDCDEPVGFAGVVDVTRPATPRLVSLFPTPRPPKGAPYDSFCERGGRFGPHNQSIALGNPHLVQDETLCFLTYFNAGLRVFDMRNPHHVSEVAYMIPKDPTTRLGPKPRTLVTQVEDVLVDARGFVYFTEKNSGLYIARWHGRS